jgi:hypothetical protein
VERYLECNIAKQVGTQRGQTVYHTVRNALERAFGVDWIVCADALSMSIHGAEEPCPS